ncbi:MAG: hypothetical protein AB6733_10755 [Clostridiaceae bacterium]
MGKEQLTKLTLKDLIVKKEQIEANKKKTADLHILSLDAVITIESPHIDIVTDALAIENGMESNKYLLYNCIVEPNLKDKELQKEYGCVEPTDILNKIFDDGEIGSIAEECLKLAGYKNSVSVVEKIKN